MSSEEVRTIFAAVVPEDVWETITDETLDGMIEKLEEQWEIILKGKVVEEKPVSFDPSLKCPKCGETVMPQGLGTHEVTCPKCDAYLGCDD